MMVMTCIYSSGNTIQSLYFGILGNINGMLVMACIHTSGNTIKCLQGRVPPVLMVCSNDVCLCVYTAGNTIKCAGSCTGSTNGAVVSTSHVSS